MKSYLHLITSGLFRFSRGKWLLGGVAAVALLAGCTAKAKLERHVRRADAYFAKGDFERARIEYINAFRLDQSDPHIIGRLGESLLEKGDVVRGVQLLARARQLQPTNNEVRLKLGSILLMAGNLKEARQEAKAVLKNSPQNADAIALLASSAATTNEVAEARIHVEAMLRSMPNNPALHLASGILLQKSGDLPGAQARLERAVALDAKSSKYQFALATLCFLRGETNQAEVAFKIASDNSKPKSIERLGYADYLVKTHRMAEAKALLTDAVSKAPDFVGAWNALAQIAFVENATDKAAEYIGKVLAQDPANRDALLNQARLKLTKHEFQAAAAGLQKLAEDRPRDSQVQYLLATAQLANDERNKALSALDKAITLNTNNVEAVLLRCQLQISRGEADNAIPELLRVTRRFPSVTQAQYLLAAAYRARGAFDEAIATYNAVAKLFPSDPQPLQLIGVTYRQQKKIPPARKAFDQALKINPDYVPAIDELIELDIADKRYEAVQKRVDGYIQKYPDKPMPRLLQAKVYFGQDKNAEAEAALKKAIELDPEFYLAHRSLADFYVRTKQTDQAITKLESMVQKNAKDTGSYLQLGMLYEIKNEYSRARDAYEALLKFNPGSIVALNNTAYLLGEHLGDLETAVKYARKAHELAPYDPFSADTLGWMLWKKGDYGLALSLLQQSGQGFTSRGQPQPEVFYHLGMAYYMTGAPAQAATNLESALQSGEEFQGKDKAERALAILKIDPAKASDAGVSLQAFGSVQSAREKEPSDNATAATGKSAEMLLKALSDNPADVIASSKLAEIYENRGDWDKARETYQKVLDLRPQSILLLSRLAALYAGPLKNTERALKLAKQAWGISQTGDSATALGPVGYLAGDYKWSYGVLLEAQRSRPNDLRITYYAGLCAYALGKLPAAQDALSRAAQDSTLGAQNTTLAKAALQVISLQTGSASAAEVQKSIASAHEIDPEFAPALIGNGLVAERNANFPAAREQYEAVLRSHPNYLMAQRQLVILLAEKLADDAKAAQIGTPLRQDLPDDALLSKALGKVAYRRGDFTEAARLLKLAAFKLATDSDLLYHLGMAQFHLNDKSAKTALTKALSIEPGSAMAADAKKALAQLR